MSYKMHIAEFCLAIKHINNVTFVTYMYSVIDGVIDIGTVATHTPTTDTTVVTCGALVICQ